MDDLFGLDLHFLSVPLKPFPRSLPARFPQGSPGIGGGKGVTLKSGDAAAVYCTAPTVSAAEIATATSRKASLPEWAGRCLQTLFLPTSIYLALR